MANKSSDQLHRLIHSMSKPEKRYFKLYTSKNMAGDAGNYPILFDAIARQEEYDEELLLKKFKNQAFSDRFAITKNRLYNAVLRSLDAYHAQSSSDARLKRQLHYIEILYKKSLYDQALKLLHAVRKSATELESLSTLVEVSKWEKRMMERRNYEEVDENSLEQMQLSDESLRKQLHDFQGLWQAKSRLFNRLYKKGRARSEADKKAFASDLALLGPHPESMANTSETKYLYHHLMSAYYYSSNDYTRSYPHLMSNLGIIRANLQIFEEEPDIYLSVLTNAIFVGMQLGKYQESFEMLEELRRQPESGGDALNDDLNIRVFSTTGNLELALYIHSGDFQKGLTALPAIEEGLFRYEDRLSALKKAQFYFNIALICFGAGRFNEALKWINQLLNNVGIDQSQDIHCFAQLFFLVIHLELGNKSLIPYALRSTQRYLQTRERVYRVEQVFLDFVNASLHKRSARTEQERFEDFLSELESLETNDFERTAFEYFDLLSWARSKVLGKSFADCVAQARKAN